MDESGNIVFGHDSTLEGIDLVVGGPLKVGATSSTNDSNEYSNSPPPSASEKKNQRIEICSVYSGQKPTVYINPIVQSDPTGSINDSVQIDVSVDQPKIIGSISNMESIQSVSELNAEKSDFSHQTAPETADKNVPKLDRRRRSRGTIVWEPLLVPSEMDGKIEMVTALKRVDSDYISAPRIGPKKHEFVKQTPFRPSTKPILSSGTAIKPSKSFQSKSPDSSEKSHHAVAISKQRASGSNIKVQMDKAIAEKEASILKEIETAMREAAKLKSKSSVQPNVSVESKSLRNEKSKADPVLKSTASVNVRSTVSANVRSTVSGNVRSTGRSTASGNVKSTASGNVKSSASHVLKKKKIEETLHDPSKDKTKLSTEFSDSMENIPSMESPLSHDDKGLPESCSNRKGKDSNSKSSTFKTPDVLQSVSSASAVVKDSITSGKIITTFGTVISSSVANGSGITALPKILTLPSSVPPPLAPLSKDVNSVNRITAAPATINPSSPSTVQRILVLATPAGMKNVGNDGIALMPITPIVTTSNLAVTSGTTQLVANNSIMKPIGSKEKSENPQDVHLYVTNFPYRGGESVSIASSSHLPVQGIPHKSDVPVALKSDSKSQPLATNAPKPSTAPVSSSSSTKRKQKMQKTMNRELASLVIDCNNVQPSSSSTLRARINRTSPKVLEDKSRSCGKIKLSNETSIETNESRKSLEQKQFFSKTKNNTVCDTEEECSSNKKRQKFSSSKTEKKSSTAVSNLQALKEKLKKIEELYEDIPPAQPQISLTPDNFYNLKHSIRTNLHELGVFSESIKHFINFYEPCQSDRLEKKDKYKENSRSKDADVDKILCRLCGSLFKKDCLIDLFSDLSKEKNILSMYSTILPQPQSIRETDRLPQHICLTCTEKLTLCFNIITQFLQADKKLRNALYDQKETVDVEEEASKELQEQSNRDEHYIGNKSQGKNTLQVTDGVFEESSKSKTPLIGVNRKRSYSKEIEAGSDVKRSKENGTNSDVEKGRSIADNPMPNHKHKRKLSKSPENNKNTTPNFSSLPKTGGCIDLSRLDPEFNDGFDVEWCLDEETIRSSLVPEEEILENLNPVPVSTNDSSVQSVIKLVRTYSASIEPCDEISPGKLVSHQNPDLTIKDEHLGSEKPNVVDEINKITETQHSISNLSVNVNRDHIPVLTSQEKSKNHRDRLFQSQETFKCPSCPMSFPNKKEAFLHKVMKHEDELTCVMKPQDKKLHSGSKQKAKDISKKVKVNTSKAVITKKESKAIKSSNEPAMCDLCEHDFPNEYALYIHKCVEHDNCDDGRSVVNDTEGAEYQIIDSNPLLENSPTESTEDTDGKILVKCGTGMLWVSSSKLITDEQKTTPEATDGNAVEHVSVENLVLSIEPCKESNSSVNSQDTSKTGNAFTSSTGSLLISEKPVLSNN